MKILLITPPMTQLNTPYPATAYLTGFLKSQGYEVNQKDGSIELALKIFSSEGLKEIQKVLKSQKGAEKKSDAVRFFLFAAADYIRTVDSVIAFLQGKDSGLANRIVAGTLLPQGPKFTEVLENFALAEAGGLSPLKEAFGRMGVQDQAKFYATLFIDDLTAAINGGIDGRFNLSRYAEKLAASTPTFDNLEKALENKNPTLIDIWIDELAQNYIQENQSDVVGFTVPFPGNVYAALRMARAIKKAKPEVKILLGGGYVNTELRSLKDPRIFNYVDFISLDDGEQPLLSILESLKSKTKKPLLRTYINENKKVKLETSSTLHDIPQKKLPAPTYKGLDLSSYLNLVEFLNPMHRIWSDGRWNKLTVAHGCYWKKCSFCDVTLDYIGRYEQSPAAHIVDHMEALIKETGVTGFHFVDEAAPPAALKAIAEEIIRRELTVSWWGNIRFEKTFTKELCELLADSGCIAVTGGLEVASNRLLKLMNKGVTVEQVGEVTKNFRNAKILVHAYLMYGFPTQTEKETVESLNTVRKLFLDECLDSAYWHRFSATIHSPIGKNPEKYGIEVFKNPEVQFSENDLDFHDPTPANHDMLGRGLKKALYNYMHGMGLEEDVRNWFEKG